MAHCVVQKSMSSLMSAIMCYLYDSGKYRKHYDDFAQMKAAKWVVFFVENVASFYNLQIVSSWQWIQWFWSHSQAVQPNRGESPRMEFLDDHSRPGRTIRVWICRSMYQVHRIKLKYCKSDSFQKTNGRKTVQWVWKEPDLLRRVRIQTNDWPVSKRIHSVDIRGRAFLPADMVRCLQNMLFYNLKKSMKYVQRFFVNIAFGALLN